MYNDLGVNSLIKFLIRSSFMDKDGTSQSYPDFSIYSIKNFNIYHPAYKLYTWFHYMHSRAGKDSLQWFLQNQRNIINMLKSRKYTELPGRFPILDLSDVANNSDLRSCNLMFLPVSNPTLDSVIDVVKRGYTCDLTVKEHWKYNMITDSKKFQQLCSIFPLALEWISPDNLKLLIKISDANFSKLVMDKFSSYSKAKDLNCNLNPYFIAAWKLYRLEAIITAKRNQNQPNLLLLESGDELFLDKLFIWASTNCYNMSECLVPDKGQFEEIFKNDLYKLVTYLWDGNPIEEIKPLILNLFSFSFAPLFAYERSKSEDQRLPYIIFFHIATMQHPPSMQWSEEAKHLSHLWNGTITDTIRNSLAYNDEFWCLIQNYKDIQSQSMFIYSFRRSNNY